MKDEKLKIGIKEIRKIVMTNDEKSRVFKNVLKFSARDEKSIQSPFVSFSFSSFFLKDYRLIYYVIIPMIFILSGGGIIFASGKSLPDGFLYPLKVSVIEPMVGFLTFSPEAKAKYESSLAIKRLVEAETLSGLGKLDIPKEKQLNNLLEKHTTALNKELEIVNQAGSTDQVNDISTNFNAEMNAHAQILDLINQENNNSKIENENKISETARSNADKIKNVSKNHEENNFGKYDKKKEDVQSLINSTTSDLNNAVNTTPRQDSTPSTPTPIPVLVPEKSSSIKQNVINETGKTLNEARDLLQEADKKKKEGDSRDAYSKLLDSESSTKEAGIFLKTGLKLKEDQHEEKKDD